MNMMMYTFTLAVVSVLALWLVVKPLHKREQITENSFVLIVSSYSWFIVITLSRAIWTTSEIRAVSFTLFLLLGA